MDSPHSAAVCEVITADSDYDQIDIRLTTMVRQSAAAATAVKQQIVRYQVLSASDFADDKSYSQMWANVKLIFEMSSSTNSESTATSRGLSGRREGAISWLLMNYWPEVFDSIGKFTFTELSLAERDKQRAAELDYKPKQCWVDGKNDSGNNAAADNKATVTTATKSACICSYCQSQLGIQAVKQQPSLKKVRVPIFRLPATDDSSELFTEYHMLAEWYMLLANGHICLPVGAVSIDCGYQKLELTNHQQQQQQQQAAVVNPHNSINSLELVVDDKFNSVLRSNIFTETKVHICNVIMWSGRRYTVTRDNYYITVNGTDKTINNHNQLIVDSICPPFLIVYKIGAHKATEVVDDGNGSSYRLTKLYKLYHDGQHLKL